MIRSRLKFSLLLAGYFLQQRALCAESVVASEASDQGDIQQSEEFAEPLVVNSFSGVPPVPGNIKQIPQSEAPEVYEIQSGDTLFDVCDQLLNEPGYWPKLWSLNPEIKNPHFIYPGMKLRFFPGDENSPPFLELVTEEDIIPIDNSNLLAEQLSTIDIRQLQDPNAKPLEPTIEVEEDPGPSIEGINIEVESIGVETSVSQMTLVVPGFVYSSELEPKAVVVSGSEGENLVPDQDQVVVREKSGLSVGGTYTVLRSSGRVSNPSTGDKVGVIYYFVANLQVVATLGGELFLAQVRDNRIGLQSGDILASFVSTQRAISLSESDSAGGGVKSTVIAHEFPSQMSSAQGGYVFLDASTTKFQNGQLVPIYQKANTWSSLIEQKELDAIGPTAVVRIIDSTDAAAVGYVVKSERVILTGDSTSRG